MHLSDEDREWIEGLLRTHHESLKEFLMAAIDDLNAAVASLSTVAGEVETAFNAADQSPAIETAVTTINTVVTALTALVTPAAAAPPAAN